MDTTADREVDEDIFAAEMAPGAPEDVVCSFGVHRGKSYGSLQNNKEYREGYAPWLQTQSWFFQDTRFTRDREALVALGVLVNRPVARGPWNPRPRQRVEPVVNSRLQAELDAMKTENKRAWDGLADIKRDCDVLREEARRLREIKEAAEKKKLVAETGQTGQKAEDKAPQVADKPKSLCSVCMAIPIDCTLVACGHTFCQTCAARVSSCPVCRTPIPWNGRIQLRLTFVE